MTDVLLMNTVDGGEISILDGFLTVTDGFGTAVYESLFGGLSWFANALIEDEDGRIESDFEEVVEQTPPSTKGLLTIEDSANRNLAWLVKINAASSATAIVSLPENNLLVVEVTIIQIDGTESKYILNWKNPFVVT